MRQLVARLFETVWQPRPMVAAVLIAATLFFVVVLFPAAAEKSGSRDIRVTDLQTAFTVERFEAVLRAWSAIRDDAVAQVKRENIIKLDFIFPAVYGLALALSYAAAAGVRPRSRRDWVFFSAPLAAALFDYGENATHLVLLAGIDSGATVRAAIDRHSFSPALIFLASSFATVKYLLLVIGIIGVAAALVRRLFGRLLATPVASSDFGDVLKDEFDYIKRRRFADAAPFRVKDGLVGLALSGGGIRSATTCLGMLQTLSRLGILPLVDYLSTVSGGGYIGSCLSSLLTLDQTAATVGRGSTPMFTTDWEKFPFNPQPGGLGAAQIRHLRTHGSFLVTRKGILKRETLRSVGQLLSGTVYHLVLAALTLSSIALLYMTVLFFGSPDVDVTLRAVTRPIRTFASAYESKLESQEEPHYRGDSVVDLEASGTPSYTVPVIYQYPSLWERIKAKADLIVTLAYDTHDGDRRRRFWRSVGPTAGFGVLVAIGAFVYLRRFRRIMNSSLSPKAGESAEEALAVHVLRIASYGSLALIVAWLVAVFRFERPPAPLWLLLPIVAIAGVRVTTWLLHVYMPRMNGTWTRDMRSLWGAYQATAVYALWAAIILAAIPILVYALHEHAAWTGFSGILALVFARVLTFRTAIDVKKRPIAAGLLHWALALAIGVGLLLVVVAICSFVVPPASTPEMWRTTAQWLIAAVLCLVPLSIVGDANRLSPHYFYRDRLAEAYLYTDEVRPPKTSLECLRDNLELLLSELHYQSAASGNEARTSAPLHLIATAINLAGSRDLTRKDRKSGYFLFSKFFCGSRHTGYRRTSEYAGGDVKLGRAVTISGAAASSGIGAGTFFAQAFATVLFNLRLGYWMPNPAKSQSISRSRFDAWHFWPKWLWREITMGTDERQSMVNLSDGGHTGDNIGIYHLLQRRCRLIIACDAECDPSLTFGSFTEALRHAYIDLGIDIDIDLTMVRPDRETGMSRSHCAVGLIRYPAAQEDDRQVGYLVYLKNSLTGDEPEPVLNYKSTNPAFPHESTADQFFDDDQFESYRALGVHIAEHAFAQWARGRPFGNWRAHAAPVPRPTY